MNTRQSIRSATARSLASLLLAATPALAQQIIQPVAVSTDMPGFSGSPAISMINQSGLSQTYTDGVTDFATFVARTSHRNSNGDSIVTQFVAGGTVTVDLGTTHTIDAMNLWGLRTFATQLTGFTLFADSDADFNNGTSSTLGSFTGGFGQGGRTFAFAAQATRFVHIQVTANGGATVVKIGEAVFRRAAPTTVAGRTILQPAAASTSLTELFGFRIGNVFDQSGLNIPYVSADTDFATYIGSAVHANANAASLLANSNGSNQPGGVVDLGETITFDLGATRDIDAIAIWNTAVNNEALVGFALFTDSDGDFTNGTDTPLGEFAADSISSAQAFAFRPASTRFVHIVVTGHLGGNFLRIGEVAFRLSDQQFGSGCPGSGGIPTLSAPVPPTPGANFTTQLQDAAATPGSAFAVIGDSKLLSPLDLAFAGASGCIVFINNLAITPFVTTLGSGSFALPIPGNSGLVGVTLFQQVLDLDPLANSLGVTTSNALTFTIR